MRRSLLRGTSQEGTGSKDWSGKWHFPGNVGYGTLFAAKLSFIFNSLKLFAKKCQREKSAEIPNKTAKGQIENFQQKMNKKHRTCGRINPIAQGGNDCTLTVLQISFYNHEVGEMEVGWVGDG